MYQQDNSEIMLPGGFIVMEEEMDENYEPTQDEIQEYAQYLGMDLQKDQKYFFIAKEGLKAPLPSQWKPCKNQQGEIFYINIQTSQMTAEHPCDEYYRKLFMDEKKKEVVRKKEREDSIKKNQSQQLQAKNQYQQQSQQQQQKKLIAPQQQQYKNFVNNANIEIKDNSYDENFQGSKILDSSLNQSYNQVNPLDPQQMALQQGIFFGGDPQNLDDQYQKIDLEFIQQEQTYSIEKSQQYDESCSNLEKQFQKQEKDEKKQVQSYIQLEKDKLLQIQQNKQSEFENRGKELKEQIQQEYDEDFKKQQEMMELNLDSTKRDFDLKQQKITNEIIQDLDQSNAQGLMQKKQEISRQREKLKDLKQEDEHKIQQQKERLQKRQQQIRSNIDTDYENQLTNYQEENYTNIKQQQQQIQKKFKEEYELKKRQYNDQVQEIQNEILKSQTMLKELYNEKFLREKKNLEISNQLSIQKFEANQKQDIDETMNQQEQEDRQQQIREKELDIQNMRDELKEKKENALKDQEIDVQLKYKNLKDQLEDTRQQRLNKLKEQYKEQLGEDTNAVDLLLQKQEIESNINTQAQMLKEIQQKNQRQNEQYSTLQKQLANIELELLSQDEVDCDLIEKEARMQNLQQELIRKNQEISNLTKEKKIKLNLNKDKKYFEQNKSITKSIPIQNNQSKQFFNLENNVSIIPNTFNPTQDIANNINSTFEFRQILEGIQEIKKNLEQKANNQTMSYSVDDQQQQNQQQQQAILPKENFINVQQDISQHIIQENLNLNNNNISNASFNNKSNMRQQQQQQTQNDDFQYYNKNNYNDQQKNQFRKRQWMNQILEERNLLNSMKFELKEQSNRIQQIQQQLQHDCARLKDEQLRIRNPQEELEMKKDILINMNKNISIKIEKINYQLQQLREQEILLQAKDKSLQNIERLYQEYETKKKQFNPEMLEELFQMYKSIEVKQPTLTINNQRETSILENEQTIQNEINHSMNEDFYGNWNKIMNEHKVIQNQEGPNSSLPQSIAFNTNQNTIISNQYNNMINSETINVNKETLSARQLKENLHKQNFRNQSTKDVIQNLKGKYDIPIYNQNKMQNIERQMISADSEIYVSRFKKNYERQDVSKTMLDDQSHWLRTMKSLLNHNIVGKNYDFLKLPAYF